MPTEPIVLHTREGTDVPASAEVVRYGEGVRMAKAAALVLGGLVGGAVLIVVPVLHLISTWLLPLAGIAGAVLVYRTTLRVSRVEATCPSCGEDFTVEESMAQDDWIRCTHCTHPLQLDVA